MTIDEAIEALEDIKLFDEGDLLEDERNAIELGIEALKRVKNERQLVRFDDKGLLPGETE